MSTEVEPQARSAMDVVQEIARGNVDATLTNELEKVAAAVLDTGKKGNVTLTLSVEPYDVDAECVVIDAKVKANTPARDMKGVFFSDRTGALTREDPRQIKMEGTE